MTENALCHACNNGIIEHYQGRPMFCICLDGLDAEMADVSRRLNDVTETLIDMTNAGFADYASSLEAFRLELEAEHDALEAEYNRRRTNE